MGGAIGGGEYTSLKDVLDGGGAGAEGPQFEGGLLSGVANAIGIKPLGFYDRQAQQPQQIPNQVNIGQPLSIAGPVSRPGAAAVTQATAPPAPMQAGVLPNASYEPIGQGMAAAPIGAQVDLTDDARAARTGAMYQPLPAASPSQAVSAEMDQFDLWLSQDPHRLATFERMPEASQLQIFRDWRRGVRN